MGRRQRARPTTDRWADNQPADVDGEEKRRVPVAGAEGAQARKQKAAVKEESAPALVPKASRKGLTAVRHPLAKTLFWPLCFPYSLTRRCGVPSRAEMERKKYIVCVLASPSPKLWHGRGKG
jgi:hypothetical protein